jgi:hypothetical protein
MSEELLVASWFDRLALTKDIFRDSHREAKQSIDFYAGKQWSGVDPYVYDDEDKIIANQIFPLVKIMVNNSYWQNPKILVRPRRQDPRSYWSANLLEQRINYKWYVMNMKREIRRIIMDAIYAGKGRMRVGYNTEILMQTGNPLVLQEGLISERSSPFRTWSDPEADVLDEAYFWFREVILPWADTKKLFKKDLPPESRYKLDVDRSFQTPILRQDNDVVDHLARARVYEIHDQLNKQIYVVADGFPKFLSATENKYAINGPLLEELVFNEIPESPHALDDISIAKDQQVELNRIRSMMMIHNRRNNRAYATTPENMDADNRARLESDRDMRVIEMSDPERFIPIKDAPISQDQHLFEMRIKEDLRESVGQNEYNRGGAVPRIKTAFETQQIVKGSDMRLNEKAALVEDFCTSLARKQIQIMQQFDDNMFAAPEVSPELGVPIEQGWRAYSRADIQGEVDIIVRAGSTTPPDEQSERQLAMQLLQAGIHRDPGFNTPEVVRWLRDKLNLPGGENLLNPQLSTMTIAGGGAGGMGRGSNQGGNGNLQNAVPGGPGGIVPGQNIG